MPWKSKKKMANEFIFKGTVSPTTHQQVIDSLSELLESLKFKAGSGKGGRALIPQSILYHLK